MLAQDLGGGARLEALEPWQAQQFAEHVAAARDHLSPWIPFASRVVDIDTAREFLDGFAERLRSDTGRLFGIWVGSELVGGTMFKDFDARQGTTEIGVWLAPQVQGRGLVMTAVRAMIDWAFAARGLVRVEWRTDPTNSRSQSIARRLGMTREGLLRGDFLVGDARKDTEVWSVLASEWPAGPDNPA